MALQERRRLLIEAASRVIARDGVPGATTRAIVAEADMPLASFHYAFESHSALMREVMIAQVAQNMQILSAVGSGRTVAEAVEIGLNGFLDGLRQSAPEQQGLMELYYYALRTPEHRGLATEMSEQVYGYIEQAFADYAGAHGLRFTVPLRQLAIQMVCITDGLCKAVLIEGDSDLLRATIPVHAAAFAGYVSDL